MVGRQRGSRLWRACEARHKERSVSPDLAVQVQLSTFGGHDERKQVRGPTVHLCSMHMEELTHGKVPAALRDSLNKAYKMLTVEGGQ